MLKALELIGFKSFADKTRFEFPPGITTVVGPNGSGKSNIVDAIKWVLGEQSAKSMRGKEMADVIFSGASGRERLNSAEATLTINNADHILPIDTDDVHITRRVYRNGEAEYLINRQPCRLRDIRELFSGTGLTTQAYSVIEQGKVDILLQSSARERRLVFEEAAGISRFKSKKIEALRRLERIDQNLLRMQDIVDEVDGQLRSVRRQAKKAARYKEYQDRLKALRTQVGLADWRHLTEQLDEIQSETDSLRDAEVGAVTELETFGVRIEELERRALEHQEKLRSAEHRFAECRQKIATDEAEIHHQRNRIREQEEEAVVGQSQLRALSVRAGDLSDQLTVTQRTYDEAQAAHAQVIDTLRRAENEVTEGEEKIEAARRTRRQEHASQLESAEAVAALASQIDGLKSQLTGLGESRDRVAEEVDAARQSLATSQGALQEATRNRDEAVAEAKSAAERLATSRVQLTDRRQQHDAETEAFTKRSNESARIAERVSVLEDWQERLEGLSSGVKRVMDEARAEPNGPLAGVRGLVAELFQVDVEMAPLVEVALGEYAQHVIVKDDEALWEYLQPRASRLPGRVGFIPHSPPRAASQPHADLRGRSGVLGRVADLIETEADLRPLVEHLLGNVWIVERLSDAYALRAEGETTVELVTRSGERLSADGVLIVGPRHTSTGLISRRAELRTLRDQLATNESALAAAAETLAALRQQVGEDEHQVHELEAAYQQRVDASSAASDTASSAAAESKKQEDRLEGLLAENQEIATQIANANRAQAAAQAEYDQRREASTAAAERVAKLEEEIAAVNSALVDAQRRVTELKVDAAKSDERLEHFRSRLAQYQHDHSERIQAVQEATARLRTIRERTQSAERAILATRSRVDELYLEKQTLRTSAQEAHAARDECNAEIREVRADQEKLRRTHREIQEKMHAADLRATECRQQRDALAARLRDDYRIELAELQHTPTEEEQRQRDAVDEEIAELRRKIASVGSVNMDALDELEKLDSRHQSLSSQYDDLAEAKAALEKIIDRINTDSRKLFADTLETVRQHFQELYRKLFGGGHADIQLEEGVDILDAGIEIVARPPGKELQNILLLSGGEKALTCVALLLAVFRSRPSPFCVLDEVDAPLDEANIERFIGVLKEFLSWTQFVIVTHSKKTMASADTLYGVTMQQSGVSKRVSVRFEDVSDDGHVRIRPPRQESGDAEAGEADDTQAA